jgi:ABC-type molybdate transport system permease subunit
MMQSRVRQEERLVMSYPMVLKPVVLGLTTSVVGDGLLKVVVTATLNQRFVFSLMKYLKNFVRLLHYTLWTLRRLI